MRVVAGVRDLDLGNADDLERFGQDRSGEGSPLRSAGSSRLNASLTFVRLSLDAIAHRFAAGSRIRVQVSGGAHPQYARNLGTDEDQTTSTRLVPSHRTVAHGRGGTSHVVLPVVP